MKFQWDFSEVTQWATRLVDVNRFNECCERITKEIAKALLKQMRSLTPVGEYTLIHGWDDNKFVVTKKDNGFEVLIVNKTPYALAVNDGHKAFNQNGGPYPIKHRVQVRSPHQWQQGDATWYVFGHFFVERGILRMTDTMEVEQIIMRELKKWWDSI